MPSAAKRTTYADSGVDIDKKDAFTESLGAVLRRTHTPRVIDNPGGFAGLFRLDFNQKLFKRNYKDPVLVACADGVGTKIKLAAELGVYDTVGIDLVAMNVNDLIVQGAEPLFFLDYIAVPEVKTEMLHALVRGVAEGCQRAGCALLGGETANMPDLYAKGDFDLAGFAVGVVELKRAQKPGRVRAGDVILGLASDGIHSNGYSLVRRIVKDARLELGKVYPELNSAAPAKKKGSKAQASKRPAKSVAAAREAGGEEAQRTLGQVLLTPTRIYAEPIVRLQRQYAVKNVITGMAHITGSGIEGNLCRALPPTLDARVDPESWDVPPVFRFLQAKGNVPEAEMWRVFNMGLGYCVIVKPAFAEAVMQKLAKMGEKVWVVGEVVKGKGVVRMG